jgi:hypothetical protein
VGYREKAAHRDAQVYPRFRARVTVIRAASSSASARGRPASLQGAGALPKERPQVLGLGGYGLGDVAGHGSSRFHPATIATIANGS